MRFLEGVFLWIAIAAYLGSFSLFLGGTVFKSNRQSSWAWRACVAGVLFQLFTVAVRWYSSGHPPVLGTFEHALAGSLAIGIIYLAVGLYLPLVRALGVVAAPFVLLMLGYGVMGRDSGITPLPPPYQSNWLWVHVSFAWIAYGAYHVSAGLGVLYLIREKGRSRNGEVRNRFFRSLPEPKRMDDLIFRLIVYGFVAHIVMLGSGAIWAYGLWGRYWAWDPIEMWSLITWVVYGLCIHLRVSYGWKGEAAAWLAIVSLAAVLITFGGIGFVGGVHTPLLQD